MYAGAICVYVLLHLTVCIGRMGSNWYTCYQRYILLLAFPIAANKRKTCIASMQNMHSTLVHILWYTIHVRLAGYLHVSVDWLELCQRFHEACDYIHHTIRCWVWLGEMMIFAALKSTYSCRRNVCSINIEFSPVLRQDFWSTPMSMRISRT